MAGYYRRDARSYHTRLGWWVMTHGRGGSAVIGGTAALVLVADLVFSLSRWHDPFARSFLLALPAMAVAGAIGRIASHNPRRPNQRVVSIVFVALIAVWLWLIPGGSYAGAWCGMVATLAAYFALWSAYWVWRPSS